MAVTFLVRNGDVSISAASGRPNTLSGSAKLRQDLKEFFEIGVTPDGFGAGLTELVGIVKFDTATFLSIAYNSIFQGLAQFRDLQRADFSTVRLDDELISTFNGIKVAQDPRDPTVILFTANINTVAGDVIPFSSVLRV